MNLPKETATDRWPQQSTSGMTCKGYSSLAIIRSNHSYNVIINGRRIGSFIHEEKAISFAKAVTL